MIFSGVQCYDTVDGAQCAECPTGYVGDGRTCSMRNVCERNPCHSGVTCQRLDHHPYFKCGSCPHGFTGDGRSCDDINEVIFKS